MFPAHAEFGLALAGESYVALRPLGLDILQRPCIEPVAQLPKPVEAFPGPLGHALRILQPPRNLVAALPRQHRQHKLDSLDLRQLCERRFRRHRRALGGDAALQFIERLGRFEKHRVIGFENGTGPVRFCWQALEVARLP